MERREGGGERGGEREVERKGNREGEERDNRVSTGSIPLPHPNIHETDVVRFLDVVLDEASHASAHLGPSVAVGVSLEQLNHRGSLTLSQKKKFSQTHARTLESRTCFLLPMTVWTKTFSSALRRLELSFT